MSKFYIPANSIMDSNLIEGLVKADRMDLYARLINRNNEHVAARAHANALWEHALANTPFDNSSTEAFFATLAPVMNDADQAEYDKAREAEIIASKRYDDAAIDAYRAAGIDTRTYLLM